MHDHPVASPRMTWVSSVNCNPQQCHCIALIPLLLFNIANIMQSNMLLKFVVLKYPMSPCFGPFLWWSFCELLYAQIWNHMLEMTHFSYINISKCQCVFLYIKNWVNGVSWKSTKLQDKVLKLSNFYIHFSSMDSGVLPTMGLTILKSLKMEFWVTL